jgi:Trypsin-like peptidase domain
LKRIAEPTLQSKFLVPTTAGQVIGSATGFIVQREGTAYLVTNRHVVTGRDQFTGKTLHDMGALPDALTILHALPQKPDRQEWEGRTERLFGKDGVPRWREHPQWGDKVDVVALPLVEVSGVELYPYDPWTVPPIKMRAVVSDFVNIVGFPFGRNAGGGFAIWTKGSIATDPDLDFDDLPAFLVDARTRQGQSGSPVILYSPPGPVALESESGAMGVFDAPMTELLGVYSGRINAESDLGYVWKRSCLVEIVDG